MKARKEAVVKVDAELLKEVEDFIASGQNKIKYSSKKQFVDVAALKLLEEERETGREKERAINERKENNIKSSRLGNKSKKKKS